MSSYFLKIICADKKFFEGDVRSCIVTVVDGGQKEILAHHENMFIALKNGMTRFQKKDSDEWIEAVTGAGFAEISNNRVILLVETAERPEDIDVARAKEAEERAEERLRQKRSQVEYYASRAALARAMERLRGASRYTKPPQ